MYGNPYMPQTQPQYMQPQNPWQARLNAMEQAGNGNPYRVINVTGEPGARAFQMPPNSSILLLDDTAPIVWLAQTDGAGYKTVTPYTITPYQPEPTVDIRSLESRIQKLEEIFNESNSFPTGATDPAAKSGKPSRTDSAE